MKLLITGAHGQLGNEIHDNRKDYPHYEFTFTDIDELDITDYKSIIEFIKGKGFDFIINCAAYTAVDKAESEKDKAYLINKTAAGNLARASAENGIKLVQISTDFIFNGKNSKPYIETDEADPLSVYGSSKLEGEKQVTASGCTSLIIRTSWLYSIYGNNFVKTIIKMAREKGKISIVYDQIGTPTYAYDLAKVILKILPEIKDGTKNIYHYSNEGVASWYDFAVAICEMTGIKCDIRPIESREYPAPAKRPEYSVLNKARIKGETGIEIPYWRNSLRKCIGMMNE